MNIISELLDDAKFISHRWLVDGTQADERLNQEICANGIHVAL